MGGGQAGMGAGFDAAVAIAAVDAGIGDMMFVAEGHGLVLHPALLSLIRGSHTGPARNAQQGGGADA